MPETHIQDGLMQENTPSDAPLSARAKIMGVAVVALLVFTAAAMIAIINDKMLVAVICALLAVSSHLVFWRQLNQSHKEKEAAGEAD